MTWAVRKVMVEELAEELAAEEPTHLGLHSKLGQRLAYVFATRQVEHELAAEGPRGQSLVGLVGAEGPVARRVKRKHVCGPAPTKERGHPRPGVSPLLGAGERGRGALEQDRERERRRQAGLALWGTPGPNGYRTRALSCAFLPSFLLRRTSLSPGTSFALITLVFTGSFPATMRFPTSSAFVTSRKNLACRVHPGWDSNVMVSVDAIASAADRFDRCCADSIRWIYPPSWRSVSPALKENEKERERERRAKSQRDGVGASAGRGSKR